MGRVKALYSAQEICDIYNSQGNNQHLTPYKITQSWVNNGLKFVKGAKKEMLFRLDWIEEYIEHEAAQNKVQNTKVDTSFKDSILNTKYTKTSHMSKDELEPFEREVKGFSKIH